MRIFISINLPQALYHYCQQLQQQFEGMKNTSEFHLTLQFLGDEINKKGVSEIINALQNITFKPFEIEMGKVTLFPNSFQPRGVWIECVPNKILDKLSSDIRQIMQKLGYLADKPFKAHITLGRYKQPPNYPLKAVSHQSNILTVEHFYLMQSTFTSQGPKYKVLKTF